MSPTPLRVLVDDATLTVDVRGEGPAVLFIHGFPFDRTMWRHQIGALRRWRRIAPDLRGVGDSSGAAHSIARHADDVVAVLDAAGAARAVVVGLSMGGYIALELLRRHPGRVRGLALCCTRATADSPEARAGREDGIARVRSGGAGAVVDGLVPKLLAPDGEPGRRAELEREIREMGARWTAAGMIGALEAMRDREDATPVLDAVSVPALVMAGAEDAIIPADDMRALSEHVPGSRWAVVPDAGHLAPLEQPFVVTRLLVDFLGSLR